MKPWFKEDDYVEIDNEGQKNFYRVERVEDLIYDYKDYGTVATVTLGSYTQIANLEPKEVGGPERRMYQIRAGTDIGMCYVEILAGSARRGTFKVPRPTSSNYYVGYFNELTSPPDNPNFDFYLLYNEVPSFAIYNPWGFTVTPYLSFKGKKISMYDLEDPRTDNLIKIPNRVEILERLKNNQIPHRRITLRGLEK